RRDLLADLDNQHEQQYIQFDGLHLPGWPEYNLQQQRHPERDQLPGQPRLPAAHRRWSRWHRHDRIGQMRWIRDRSGLAALEMAPLAPFLIAVMIAGIDFGGALLAKAKVARMLAASAEYATLAGQNGVTWATIQTNAGSIARSVTSAFVGTPTVTAVINQ